LSTKKAIVTGIFGQDGSYFLELLSEKGYEVHGIEKKELSNNSSKIQSYLKAKSLNPIMHDCDLMTYKNVREIVESVKPHEIYHLAAIHYSSQQTNNIKESELYVSNLLSTLNLLEAVKEVSADAKVIIAGSCLMYDASAITPQNENTPLESHSLYGLAKIAENGLIKYFRQRGMHASMAILYNHESPRRDDSYVTRKIVKNMVLISKKEINSFELGDLDVNKDWGYAKDYVKGMWLMAQNNQPGDYIIATGKTHKVREFIDYTAKCLGIKEWQKYIKVNPQVISRRVKVDLVGDATLAYNRLNWRPTLDFTGLIELMTRNELSNTLD